MTKHLGFQEPLGLLYLAAALEKACPDAHIQVYDGQKDRSMQAIRRRLAEVRPDILGMSIEFPKLFEACEIARVARGMFPDVRVVAGGSLVSLFPAETARLQEFDAAVAGQAEVVFPDVVARLVNREALTGLGGVYWRLDGKVVLPTGPAPEPDLDRIPWPAHHLLCEDYYFSPADGGPVTGVLSSRGCPFSCGFCGKMFSYRGREPRTVGDELEALAARGRRTLIFWDECFNVNEERVRSLCEELIRRALPVHFAIRARPKNVTAGLAGLLYRAGCRRVQFGLDAATVETLRYLGKGTDLEEAVASFRHASEAGLRTGANIILGLPGQDVQDARRALKFIDSLRPDFLQVTGLALNPKSRLFREAAAEGKVDPLVFEKYMADPVPHFCQPLLFDPEVFRWVAQAYRRFYLRPSRIWSEIRHTRSIRSLLYKAVGAAQVLRLQPRALLRDKTDLPRFGVLHK